MLLPLEMITSADSTEQPLTMEYSARHNSKYKWCITGTHYSDILVKFLLYDCSWRVPRLQYTQANGGSQPSVTPVAEDIMSSCDPFGQCKHVQQRHTFRQITHTCKMKVKRVFNWPGYYNFPDTLMYYSCVGPCVMHFLVTCLLLMMCKTGSPYVFLAVLELTM